MKRVSTIVSKYTKYCIVSLFLMICSPAFTQTPGMIIKPAAGAGAAILDPDGDGYVSQKSNGIQAGFTIPPDNDVFQSEIPYVALVRPDIQGDLERGPTGGFTEIVGTDAAGNNAVLTYSDDNYLYYRFRLSGYAPNSKSYSILIDTDQKFGFTGPNADPNAVVGNPGFEAEVVLETNFNIYAYNVDGSASRPEVAASSALYDTNCQKSMAVSNAGGDPDYFYDFFLPYPTALFTKTTPLRYVAITSMNPMPAIGNNAVSDVGGVGDVGDLDQALEDLIEEQIPTLPGQEVLERTDCPLIDAVAVGNTTITGTTEVTGATINVYVYQSNGTTLVGSGTTTTAGSNWSINVSALNPAVTLTTGYKVKATASAPGKGVSYDNCDIETVTSAPCTTPAPITIGFSNSDKNIDVTFSTAVSGTVTVYNSNGTIWKSQSISNSTIATLSGGTPVGSGNKIPDGSYYATLTVGSCESGRVYGCLNSTTASSKPTIDSPVTLGSGTITGSGGIAGAIIIIYANGNQIATTTTGPGTWSANVSNLLLCQSITAKQVETGKCISLASDPVTVTRTAVKPSILNSGCFSSPGTVSGTSTEIGATVTLYKTAPSTATLGTATVGSNGSWSVNNLTLNNGDVIAAAVTSGAAGTCITASVNSTPVTISTQTNISNYTIAFNPITEKQPSVSGTISGGTYPVTLKLYVDESFIGTATVINSAGNWTVSGLTTFDLAVGSKVQATVTGTGCESALSSNYATVNCITPLMPAYTGGSKSYCDGGTGVVALSTSEVGVIYQLVNASGVAQGPAVGGTGNNINLYTNIISAPLTGLYVKAYKMGNNACAVISGTVINFDTENPSPTVTFSSTSLSVVKGTTSVSLPYTAKSVTPSADNYTIDYSLAANNQGFIDVTVQTAIPGSAIALAVPAAANVGVYSGTITIYSTNASACTTSYGFTVTVYQAGTAPVISVQPVNKTICSGQTAPLSVSASGTVTSYQWQSSTSYSGTYTNVGTNSASYTTSALAATTYYRVIVSNTNGSVTSNVVTVTVTPAVSGTGTISGTPTVCAGQNGVNYSVSGITNGISYTWEYTGTGAFINGTGSSVFINFGVNATGGTLTVTGSNSCTEVRTATYLITISPPPTPTFIDAPTISSCVGHNATYSTEAGQTNYIWTVPGILNTDYSVVAGSTATNSITIKWLTTGSKTVTVNYKNAGGCLGTAAASNTITVHALPNPSEIIIH